MQNTILDVKGMTCEGCVRSVERVLKAVPGVSGVAVSLAGGTVCIDYDGVPVAQLSRTIEEAGFEVTG